MNKKTLLAAALLALAPALLRAEVTFTFTEVGSDVVMTSSGTLDTSKLVQDYSPGWNGIGLQASDLGSINVMGSTIYAYTDDAYRFHAGTDFSAIVNPVGPFAFDSFANWVITEGTKSFATYGGWDDNGFLAPGISLVASDVVNGLWTPDQKWINTGTTFAALGLNVGVYSVVDSETKETITIRVSGVPGNPASVPDGGATLALLGASVAGLALLRRRRQA